MKNTMTFLHNEITWEFHKTAEHLKALNHLKRQLSKDISLSIIYTWKNCGKTSFIKEIRNQFENKICVKHLIINKHDEQKTNWWIHKIAKLFPGKEIGEAISELQKAANNKPLLICIETRCRITNETKKEIEKFIDACELAGTKIHLLFLSDVKNQSIENFSTFTTYFPNFTKGTLKEIIKNNAKYKWNLTPEAEDELYDISKGNIGVAINTLLHLYKQDHEKLTSAEDIQKLFSYITGNPDSYNQESDNSEAKTESIHTKQNTKEFSEHNKKQTFALEPDENIDSPTSPSDPKIFEPTQKIEKEKDPNQTKSDLAQTKREKKAKKKNAERCDNKQTKTGLCQKNKIEKEKKKECDEQTKHSLSKREKDHKRDSEKKKSLTSIIKGKNAS